MLVGFRQGRFEDAARTNWDGSGPRPLRWAAWYPAADGAGEAELFPDTLPERSFVIGPAARDAPINPARPRYPIVLLTHGTGGQALQLEWLARDLARHGFIAVGVDHHGNSNTEPYRAEGFLCWWERAHDLTVLLDHLQTLGEFAGAIDIDRAFVAGFSLGGCTAAALLGAISASSRFSSADRDAARGPREFPDLADHLPGLLDNSAIFRASWARMSDSYRDERFKAALLLAPGRSVQGFSEQSLAAIKTPTRIIVGESDFVAPGAIWLHERLRTSTLELLPQGTGHYVFLPEATSAGRLADPVCCIDAPGIDRRTVHGHAFTSALGLFLSV